MRIAFLFLAFFFAIPTIVNGQNQCFSKDEADKLIRSMKNPSVVENPPLKKELLRMQSEQEKISQKMSESLDSEKKYAADSEKISRTNLLRVCSILKDNGWLNEKSVGKDGAKALVYIISNNQEFAVKREFLPVLAAATKLGLVGNPVLASLVDSIRVGSGATQIFGTQATIRNEVVYLHPLLNEKKVDEWRKLYDLIPLRDQLRDLESRYRLPVVKMPIPRKTPTLTGKSDEKSIATALGIVDEEDDIVKVDTQLVNLNVRILNKDLKLPTDLSLTQADFVVTEDDKIQDIAFFSSTERPFDLVLILDYSGSTMQKRGLIQKAAKRFVEYARPTDRIAVVIFAGEIRIACELTSDKVLLKKRIDNFNLDGGSPVWDSLQFTYDNIIKKESVGRRSAVVFMTDGEDYSRGTLFADLMETVRLGDTTIFPVYLIPESRSDSIMRDAIRQKGRQSLWLLAEESGGQMYGVADVKDLTGIYEQILDDLGKVYSIGYNPLNSVRDGSWRNVSVKVKPHPDYIIKTRRGYYAK